MNEIDIENYWNLSFHQQEKLKRQAIPGNCPECDGVGYIARIYEPFTKKIIRNWPCPICSGTGDID